MARWRKPGKPESGDQLSKVHDTLFKAVLDDPVLADELLRQHLDPAVVALLEPGPPEQLDSVLMRTRLRTGEADKLFRYRLRGGGQLFVYCVAEHKSTPERMVGRQLFRYIDALWDRLEKAGELGAGELPMVVALVVYNGKAPWGPSRRLSDVIKGPDLFRDHLELRYGLIDVGHDPPERLSREGPLRGVLRALSLHIHDELRVDGVRRRLEIEAVFRNLREGPDWLINLVMEYVVGVNIGTDEVDVEAGFAAVRPGEEEQMTSPFVQKYLNKGRLEGQASMLLKALEHRFNTVPAAISERVRQADEQQLYAWHDRVFDAESLDQVFEEQLIIDS